MIKDILLDFTDRVALSDICFCNKYTCKGIMVGLSFRILSKDKGSFVFMISKEEIEGTPLWDEIETTVNVVCDTEVVPCNEGYEEKYPTYVEVSNCLEKRESNYDYERDELDRDTFMYIKGSKFKLSDTLVFDYAPALLDALAEIN